MKSLFEPETLAEVQERLAKMTPHQPRRWGKMTVSQALAHCSRAMEWGVGETVPPPIFLGRLLGRVIKSKVVGNDLPMRRNTGTSPDLVVEGEPEFDVERARLSLLLERFGAGGPEGCTKHPHNLFGPLTPEEWAGLMYKHLDHHLRQFGV